ncbi:Ldh family oxidoreductase [Thermovenabulum gondwanense]|uniref:Ureidoglycolate dehydrogenase (NAD(+)) n=1 Tax=Thermovenabulum gondwanense TaxID=520767 RepID=A0A162MXQ1_9FIRM|nr:Ldh family oxidoreductase [Thermovenabulum gondwanense]KYO68081.1 Ureidoglycolate dehydrogenase (NAD(+)) [Thermovenabulum gondwanense]
MRIPVEVLKNVAQEILIGLGETKENAEVISEILVNADMRGVSTHGTYLLKVISMRVEGGQLKLPTLPKVISDKEATAVIDGMDGIGMVAGKMAVDIAVEKAKKYGVGMSLICNTNNVGCLGVYTQRAAKEGMIAIMSCNAAPAMAPWGAAEKFLGTNPIAISIPGKDTIFTSDMATSVVARGKIREASRKGIKIPDNWALDSEGRPTTDPEEALKGTLMPIGGPKGSSLAMAVDIISGILSGSGYGNQLKSFHVLEGPTRVGASAIMIDVSHFMELEKFKELVEGYFTAIKALKKAQGVEEILIPGEIEFRKEQKSLEDGIEIDDKLVITFDELLKKINSNIKLISD